MTIDISKIEKLELHKLSEVYNSIPDPEAPGLMEKLHPGYYTHWCRFMQGGIETIQLDSVAIVHGPQGCIGTFRDFLMSYIPQFHGHPFLHWVCTNMNATDAILGAENKLRQAILEVDKLYKPRAIFVVVTCCAGIIQEGVEDVAKDMETQVDAEKIITLRFEGHCSYATTFLSYHMSRYARELVPEGEPKRKIPRSVNILGVSKETHYPAKFPEDGFPEDSHELERLFNKMGITVNSVLTQNATLDAFERAPEAELNVVVCPQLGNTFAIVMEERFGMPYIRRLAPIGVTAISNFLKDVGKHFNLEKEAEKVIAEEYALIKDDWEEAKRMVQGKIALVEGGDVMTNVGRAIAWSQLASDLGMRPIIFNLPAIEIRSKHQHVLTALEMGYDFDIVWGWNYAYKRRLHPQQVLEALGFKPSDVGVYMDDVFPTAVAKDWETPVFDPSNSPRIIACTHCNKQKGSPGRRVGFTAAGRTARDIIDANKMAKRNCKPTLFGRLGGL
jgi:nitrogenase molybdenum-iron protein alpha/beta subunit